MAPAVTTAATTFDPIQVRSAVRLLARHGGVVEVRIPKTRQATVSGYFDDLDALVAAVRPWDGKASVYVTLNPVAPALLARALNRLEPFARATTADADVLRRSWLPFDFDPARPSGISATDDEMHRALACRNEAVAFLSELGFPAPVTAMSGNGGHALYAIDLPNDQPTTELIERALKALKGRFPDPAVTVDEAVSNAARIWKLYGTAAVKGDATTDRPHRRAELQLEPSPLLVVPPAALASLASLAPRPKPFVSLSGRGPLDRIDLVAAFQERGLYRRPLHGGKHAVTCPWAEAHSSESSVSETVIFDRGEGEPWGFDCRHAHCASRTIRDVLSALVPRNGHANGYVNSHAPGNRPETAPPPDAVPSVAAPASLATKDAGRDAEEDAEEAASAVVGAGSPLPPFPPEAWRGVFEDYRVAMTATSETPDTAHFSALWAACAAKLRRHVSMHYAYETFPNIYLVNFGPTGDGKTTGQRGALSLLEGDDSMKVLRGLGSAEALGDWMSNGEEGPYVSHLIFLEELSTLLVRAKWEGSTLMSFLTETFDTPPRYDVPFRKNPVKVIEPTPVLLAGTTPEWFWKSMREVDFYGGFGNRLFFLTGDPKPPVPLPPRPDALAITRVRKALAELRRDEPRMLTLSKTAYADVWDPFYRKFKDVTTRFDPLLVAATKRVPAYALKLAMVYASLEHTDEITEDQVNASILVAHYGIACTRRLVEGQQHATIQGRCEQAVLRALKDGPLPAWRIHRAIGGRFNAEEVGRAIRALIAGGQIKPLVRTTPRGEPILALRAYREV